MNRYSKEINLLFGENWSSSNSVPGLDSLVSSVDFNKTLFATGKSLTLIGIVPLYTFLLLYYKDFFAEFLVRYSSKNQQSVLHWINDSGQVIQDYLVGILKITLEKSDKFQAFGFLLSDDVQVNEDSENFWKILRKKFSRDKK